MTKITLCLFANKIYSMTGSRFMPCRQFKKPIGRFFIGVKRFMPCRQFKKIPFQTLIPKSSSLLKEASYSQSKS